MKLFFFPDRFKKVFINLQKMRATCASRVLGRTAVTRCSVALRGRGPAMTTSVRSADVPPTNTNQF
jgi:hypothetical protein